MEEQWLIDLRNFECEEPDPNEYIECGFALFGENNPAYGKEPWNKGIQRSEAFRNKITGEGNGYSQWWKITFNDGRQIVRCGLTKWCKENGYHKGHISAIYKKQRQTHKDIVAVEKVAHRVSQSRQGAV